MILLPAAPDLNVEPLARHHDRSVFSCGVESLDLYLKTQAGQDVKRKANGVFVLVKSAEPREIMGYYTLCAASLAPGDVPVAARKHIPRYPLVSTTLIGRLAVAQKHRGAGLGALLLADALRRASRAASTIGSSMVVVDATYERAAAFYKANGFIQLPDSLRSIIPMQTIVKLFAD